MPFLFVYIEARTTKFFKRAESWLVGLNFRRGSRMQGMNSSLKFQPLRVNRLFKTLGKHYWGLEVGVGEGLSLYVRG